MPTVNKTLEQKKSAIEHIEIELDVIDEVNTATTAKNIPQDVFQTATTFLKNGFYDRAENLFRENLKLVPTDTKCKIGLIAVKQRDANIYDVAVNGRKSNKKNETKISYIYDIEEILLSASDAFIIQNILQYIAPFEIREDSINWKEFDIDRFEQILRRSISKSWQTNLLLKYINAALCASNTDDSTYAYKVFCQMVKYLPEEDVSSIMKKIGCFAEAFLMNAEFELALSCANIWLKFESSFNTDARFALLLATLKCKNEDELLCCEQFNSAMPEYMELIKACRNDLTKLKIYADLPERKTEKLKNINEQKQLKKIEEENLRIAHEAIRRAEDEKIKKQKEEKKQARKDNWLVFRAVLYTIVGIPIFCFILYVLMDNLNIDNIIVSLCIFGVISIILSVSTIYATLKSYEDLLAFLVLLNSVFPASFSFFNWFKGGHMWLGIVSFILSIAISIIEYNIVVGMHFRVINKDLIIGLVLAFITVPLALAIYIDYMNGSFSKFGIAVLVGFGITVYLGTNAYSIIARKLILSVAFLMFAWIALFVVTWSGWGIILGAVSALISLRSLSLVFLDK